MIAAGGFFRARLVWFAFIAWHEIENTGFRNESFGGVAFSSKAPVNFKYRAHPFYLFSIKIEIWLIKFSTVVLFMFVKGHATYINIFLIHKTGFSKCVTVFVPRSICIVTFRRYHGVCSYNTVLFKSVLTSRANKKRWLAS